MHHISYDTDPPYVLLLTFREELEFDSAVDALGHSDKSDTGLILSCSDDRLLSSNSESKLS